LFPANWPAKSDAGAPLRRELDEVRGAVRKLAEAAVGLAARGVCGKRAGVPLVAPAESTPGAEAGQGRPRAEPVPKFPASPTFVTSTSRFPVSPTALRSTSFLMSWLPMRLRPKVRERHQRIAGRESEGAASPRRSRFLRVSSMMWYLSPAAFAPTRRPRCPREAVVRADVSAALESIDKTATRRRNDRLDWRGRARLALNASRGRGRPCC
jgi:hypothetical protein